jgi:hypothetical protein
MVQQFLEKRHAFQRVAHQQQGAIKGAPCNGAQEPGGIPSSGGGLWGRQSAL